MKNNTSVFPLSVPGMVYEDGSFEPPTIAQEGINCLAYFAARAPHKIPKWFKPEMPPRPEKTTYVSDDGKRIYYDYGDAFSNEEFGFYDKWERDFDLQKTAQWPWYWANLVLSAYPKNV